MIGELPKKVKVAGKYYHIRPDYINILRIITAFNDDDLKDSEKAYICLRRFYVDFQKMENSIYDEAFQAALKFIECNIPDGETHRKKLVDWEQDEQLIFSAINITSGIEVREKPAMHWWTFLGYFQSISQNTLWAYVLTIRQKRSKHIKLDKSEQDFYNSNRALVELGGVSVKNRKKDAENYLQALFDELSQNEGE